MSSRRHPDCVYDLAARDTAWRRALAACYRRRESADGVNAEHKPAYEDAYWEVLDYLRTLDEDVFVTVEGVKMRIDPKRANRIEITRTPAGKARLLD